MPIKMVKVTYQILMKNSSFQDFNHLCKCGNMFTFLQ